MKRVRRGVTALTLAAVLVWGFAAAAAQLTTRTLAERPAVVIAAFGTSTKAQVTYDVFERALREEFPETEIRWAFTSEVIREIVNERWARDGIQKRLSSLQQALADLEAEGFTKVAIQPLHIFPGEEYEEVLSIARGFPGLKIEIGETLLQRWEGVREVVAAIAAGFLPPEEGANVVVAHGTPTTHSGANIAILGLERHLLRNYPNAYVGTIDGVIAPEEALGPATAHPGKRVRFVPLMYVAGDHVMNDVMGEGAESWRSRVEAAGKTAEAPTVELEGKTYYRGLGFLPEVNEIFLREIHRALGRL